MNKIILLLIMFSLCFSNKIPDEYYLIKNKLSVEDDGMALSGINISKEKDSEAICGLINILSKIEVVTEEFAKEGAFVRYALPTVWPLAEYGGDIKSGVKDNFKKCPANIANCYRKLVVLIQKNAVERYKKLGTNETDAKRFVNCANMIGSDDVLASEEGFAMAKKLLERDKYNIVFMRELIEYSLAKKNDSIQKMAYNEYLWKIPSNQFLNGNSIVAVNMLLFNANGINQRKTILINYMSKLKDANTDSIKFNSASIYYANVNEKNRFLDYLLDKSIINDASYANSCLGFIKNNPYLVSKNNALPKHVISFIYSNKIELSEICKVLDEN